LFETERCASPANRDREKETIASERGSTCAPWIGVFQGLEAA
jgi:hypothetical protein